MCISTRSIMINNIIYRIRNLTRYIMDNILFQIYGHKLTYIEPYWMWSITHGRLPISSSETRFNSQERHTYLSMPTGVELCGAANLPLLHVPFLKPYSWNVVLHISHLIQLKLQHIDACLLRDHCHPEFTWKPISVSDSPRDLFDHSTFFEKIRVIFIL